MFSGVVAFVFICSTAVPHPLMTAGSELGIVTSAVSTAMAALLPFAKVRGSPSLLVRLLAIALTPAGCISGLAVLVFAVIGGILLLFLLLLLLRLAPLLALLAVLLVCCYCCGYWCCCCVCSYC